MERQNTESGFVGHISDFIESLKSAGIPISVSDKQDALDAFEIVGFSDRSIIKSCLRSVLINRMTHISVFDTVFSVYFPGTERSFLESEIALSNTINSEQVEGTESVDFHEKMFADITAAMVDGSEQFLQTLANSAVSAYSEIDPERPVGSSYYLYKTIRSVGLEDVVKIVSEEINLNDKSDLDKRIAIDKIKRLSKEFRKMVEAEIRRRLVLLKGVETVAAMTPDSVIEDSDFIYATKEEMQAIKKAIAPMAKKIAINLARKRKKSSRGVVDIRKTIRKSLSTGGVPVTLEMKVKSPSKPELVVIADISGSVASFARFTLHLIHGLSSQFSKVKSYVFIDGLDDVTTIFQGNDIDAAISRVSSEADVIWTDGHSNYGHAFEVFDQKYIEHLTNKSTVLILGDARNNYHHSNAEALSSISNNCKRLIWLNPEPEAYWNSGDSIMRDYQPYCDETYEVRNLKQLEEFVDTLS